MNFVIVKQADGKYLFEVPEGFRVTVGENVVVSTCRGERTGVALCDSFFVGDEETQTMIMNAWGTKKERMKPVLGFVEFSYFDERK